MLLGRYYGAVEIHRAEKIVWVKFLSPHRVISTCRVNGGIREDLECVYNHQSCEPNGHFMQMDKIMTMDADVYMSEVCKGLDLNTSMCASLGTAANMNNTTVSHEQFRELEVVTVCTGGVETNAGRAGDPADYYESEGGFIKLREEASPDGPGTINLMVFINQELTLSALVRSVVTVTEAKTSVLEELAVGSKFSDGSATGTGTDQVGVSCLKGTTPALTWAGKHDKLGELIGVTVRNALKETLARQNGLTPEKQCSASVHLERFGTDRDSFRLGVMKLLSEQRSDLLCRNFDVIDRDPMTVAAVTALTHLLDKVRWKLIPHTCLPEILCSFGAQAAAAVSGKYDRISWYRDALSQKVSGTDNASFLALLQESFALGFDDKWD